MKKTYLELPERWFPKKARYRIVKGTRQPKKFVELDNNYYEVYEMNDGCLFLKPVNVVFMPPAGSVRIPKKDMPKIVWDEAEDKK